MTAQAPAPGQAEYEAAVQQAAAWSPAVLRPTWDELALSNRIAWGEIAATKSLGAREHCLCLATGPQVITWSARYGAWCHTDGYPCSASKGRPASAWAPAAAEGVLF